MIKSHKHIALVAALLVSPAAVVGQEHGAGKGVRPSAPASFCFNGARRSKCATFVIAEMQGSTPLIRSTREVSWGGGPRIEEAFFGERLQWELGLMHNVSDRWAVGGAARLGSGSSGAVTALSARARRWMSDVVAVDVSAGAGFTTDSYPSGPKAHFTADARLNFRDDAYVGLRFDQLRLAETNSEWAYDAGGQQRALSLLAGVGSEGALGGSAAAGLGLILLLSLADWE
jgi:hypothetical protein